MIHGIGIDLCSIERIKKVFDKFGIKFAKRILSEAEFKCFTAELDKVSLRFNSSNSNDSKQNVAVANDFHVKIKSPKNFLAKRFAAKEAFAKALGCGIGKEISFCDIEIRNNIVGKPEISIVNKPDDFLKNFFQASNFKIFLSLSDENKPMEAVLAMVVIEKF